MFFNFISHTPAGYNSCEHLWHFFIDTHTHTHTQTVGWGLQRQGAPAGDKSSQPLGPTICGKDLPSSLTFNVWVDIKLQPPPPCTRPANYNKLLHVASSHLNSSYRHVCACTAPTYSPHSFRNGQLTLVHIFRSLFRGAFFPHPPFWATLGL